MAIITKIRTKAGLLVAIVIGIALFAFIVSDLTSNKGGMSRRKLRVAEMNGNNILYPDLQQRIVKLEEIIKLQYGQTTLDEQFQEEARNQAWQELIQEYVLQSEYEKMGLSVDNLELSDIIQGPDPHPIIRQMFTNPETGEFNRLALNNFIQQMKEDEGSERKIFWKYLEDMIYQQRLFAKYSSIVSKGLYATKVQTDRRDIETMTSVDFSFIQKPYSSVTDSISISESDIKKYYNAHKNEFKQPENTRDIEYVAFTVVPSEKDVQDAEKWINEIKPEFETVNEVKDYVNLNSDIPFDTKNYKTGELPELYNEFMFSSSEGMVYGPYFEDNTYKLAKLSKINYISDSVHVSQIVLQANQNNVQQVQLLADSLLKVAKAGADFATLARNNSQDRSAQTGGDMGWIKEGTNGPSFSDSVFYAKEGDIKLAFTQTALCIVKVTGKSTPVKKVQVGVLAKQVTPSAETDQLYYSKATAFAGTNNSLEKFKAAVVRRDVVSIPVMGIKHQDNNIQGIEKSRRLVRWAFESKEGDICPQIESYGSTYIVAVLTKIHEKGFKPIDEVASAIKIEVRREKKAEKLLAELKPATEGATSIDAVSSKLGLSVQSATGLRFTSYAIPGAGPEPKVIAAALGVDAKKITSPIAGENGVFILYVDNKVKNENQFGNDPRMARTFLERSYALRTNNTLSETIIELAKITDNRGIFY